MGQTMSWSESSAIRDAAQLVDDAVTAFRTRGYTRETALHQAALALGISPRRAKGLVYGEVFAMALDEYRQIKARFLRHLDDEAESLAARSEAARARRKQMELEL